MSHFAHILPISHERSNKADIKQRKQFRMQPAIRNKMILAMGSKTFALNKDGLQRAPWKTNTHWQRVQRVSVALHSRTPRANLSSHPALRGIKERNRRRLHVYLHPPSPSATRATYKASPRCQRLEIHTRQFPRSPHHGQREFAAPIVGRLVECPPSTTLLNLDRQPRTPLTRSGVGR